MTVESAARAEGEAGDSPWTFSVFFENDLFGDTDQNYTNGLKFAWTSPDLTHYRESGTLPAWSEPYVELLPFINEPGLQRNVVLSIGQSMFTPEDIDRSALIEDDRPYAGYLYGGLAFLNKNERRLDAMVLRLGIVGPLSFAEEAQVLVHQLRGLPKPKGWRHQLENEPAIEIVYERTWRALELGSRRGLGFDLLTRAGGALGNVAISASTGLEARVGWRVPVDFGTSLIRPSGDTNAPVVPGGSAVERSGVGIHLFASAAGRAVGRDIFLDGNTFADSHRVDKKHVVGDFAVGVSLLFHGLKLSYAQVLRTREFDGQEDGHRFGSLTLTLSR